jgi:hypothetical protein
MIPLPKPRGFWDYALFALIMTGALSFGFWLDASEVGWPDFALAGVAATLLVFAIILARRVERARWIAHPTWHVYLLLALGVSSFIFGATYADAFLFHRSDLTSSRLRHDIIPAVLGPAAVLWSSRSRFRVKRQVL